MIGESKRRGEIGRTPAGRAVDAGLEGIAFAATQSLRHAPVGAAAGEGETGYRIGREVIIEACRAARRARGQIMAADHCEIAGGAVAAAVGAAPRGPARLIDWHRRWGRL